MTNTWLTFENWVVFDVCACVSVPTEQDANDLINSLVFFGHEISDNSPLHLTNGTYLVGVKVLCHQSLTRLQTTLNYLRSQLCA